MKKQESCALLPECKLTGVSVSYSPVEDRLRLVGMTDSGEAVVLWCSLRIMNMINPHIHRFLRQNISTTQLDNAQKNNNGDGEKSPPPLQVSFEDQTVSVLVQKIDLSHRGNHCLLAFEGKPHEARYILGLPAIKLYRWWAAVEATCRLGGWNLIGGPIDFAAGKNIKVASVH